MDEVDTEVIFSQWQERENEKKKKEKLISDRSRAAHLKACMDYDDAKIATRSSFKPRSFRCSIGFHKSRWNPRWKHGTYGFCTDCGAETGGGIAYD